MKQLIPPLAALGLAAGLFAQTASEQIGQHIWQYEPTTGGVRITRASRVSWNTPLNATLTIPSTLGGKPVVEIEAQCIDGSMDIKKINFPSTFRSVAMTWTGGDDDYFLDYTFMSWDTPREKLTLNFTGGPVPNFYGEDYLTLIDGEEDWGYPTLSYPTSGTAKSDWEKLLAWEAPYVDAFYGAPIWHDTLVPQWKPNIADRAKELTTKITALGASSADGKNAAIALNALIALNSDSGIRNALKAFGITFPNNIPTADLDEDDPFDKAKYQPNDGLTVLTSSSVQKQLQTAIDALAKVSAKWSGMALRPEDFPFIAETMIFDGADAKVLKAALEGLCAAAYEAKSYDLPLDYAKPLYPIQGLTTIKADTDAAWAAVPKSPVSKCQRGDLSKVYGSSLQLARIGNDLLVRLSLVNDSEHSQLVFETSCGWFEIYFPEFSASRQAVIRNTWDWEAPEIKGSYSLTKRGNTEIQTCRFPNCADDVDGVLKNWRASSLWGGQKAIDQWLMEDQTKFGIRRSSTTGLDKAESFARKALASSLVALDALWARKDDALHFVNFGQDLSQAEMNELKGNITSIQAAMDTPTKVQVLGERLYLAPLFGKTRPDRTNLPTWKQGAFVEGTESDASYCGILPDRAPQKPTKPDPDPTPDLKPGYARIAATIEGKGTVRGVGDYKVGRKVTLQAKPDKGHVFAGWYLNGTPVSAETDYRTPTLKHTMTAKSVTYTARFVPTAQDKTISIQCALDPNGYEGGINVSIPVTVTSASLPKLKAKGLPSAVRLNSKTLTLEGMPRKPGLYTIALTATNTSKASTTVEYTFKVRNYTSPAIPVEDRYDLQAGTPSAIELAALGNVRVSGLPAGVKWNKATGTLIGTPTKPGNYTVTFTKNGAKATATFVVADWADPTLSVDAPDSVVSGAMIKWTLQTEDANRITTRGLPWGVRLRKTTDKVTKRVSYTLEGTPIKPGTYTMVITATNGGRKSVTVRHTVKVEKNPAVGTYCGFLRRHNYIRSVGLMQPFEVTLDEKGKVKATILDGRTKYALTSKSIEADADAATSACELYDRRTKRTFFVSLGASETLPGVMAADLSLVSAVGTEDEIALAAGTGLGKIGTPGANLKLVPVSVTWNTGSATISPTGKDHQVTAKITLGKRSSTWKTTLRADGSAILYAFDAKSEGIYGLIQWTNGTPEVKLYTLAGERLTTTLETL
ncbi:MAG: putative Ig domain-containing protein [Candidatus Spyradenecus sp.]